MTRAAAEQMTMAATPARLPEWAGEPMRLDPFGLPHRVGHEGGHGFSFTLDRGGAVLKRQLSRSRLPLSIALPTAAFRGVAARAIAGADGQVVVTLELHHADEALCLPLLVSGDLDDIAADWHAWSRLLRLPMLIVGEDAIARPVRERLGALMVETPVERRKRITRLRRRPSFLRRRKVGAVGPVTKITGEELIARR